MKTFAIKARDIINYTAYVDAETPEEALAKFNGGEWDYKDESEQERQLWDGGDVAEELA